MDQKKILTEEAQSLRRELDARRKELENMMDNIPGGVHQCNRDPYLTLITMSHGFLSMFGYTREDIKNLFNDHFIEMIYPEDRENVLKQVNLPAHNNKDIEIEYRVMQKNGFFVWVLDKARLYDDGNGRQSFYCVLLEITVRKREQEELRLSLERHKVIMDQTIDIIFEWDIRNDELSFSPNWKIKFGYDAISSKISHRIPLSENIHPDDMTAFVKIMHDTSKGIPYSQTEFRIRDLAGLYYWCRIRATVQYDSDGNALKAVGVITDIDEEKKQKEALYEKAHRDALTGLYNKSAIEALVEGKIHQNKGEPSQALMIIDIDYFKEVNDTYGHLAGDGVLSDVAAVLKAQSGGSYLAGRIGGDEFLIYIPETGTEDVLLKAGRLFDSLRQITPQKGAAPISCSIGAVVFSREETGYQALYQAADQALYYQKRNGRGGVTIYNPELFDNDNGFSLLTTEVSKDICSVGGNVVDEQIAQYSFRTLYAARDVESTLNRLLAIIGRSYDVSRVYIFESTGDGEHCSKTFEWWGSHMAFRMDYLQDLPYCSGLEDYRNNFNDNGIFYRSSPECSGKFLFPELCPSCTHNMLQCAIFDEGNFAGFVGFDEYRENQVWSRQQMASLKLTADVLSCCLIKMRQKQKLKKIEELCDFSIS